MADLFRVLIICMGVASLALSAASLYYFAQRQVPHRLLTHVARVTLTYYAFVFYGITEVIVRFGSELTPRAPALFLIFVLAFSAQVPLYRYEKENSHA